MVTLKTIVKVKGMTTGGIPEIGCDVGKELIL